MSDTTITNIPSALETRVKEPSDGAQVPPSGPGSSDRFNGVLQNKNNQSFDNQLNFTEGHIEKNFTEGPIENPAIGAPIQIVNRGDHYNDFAIQTQRADSYQDLNIAELREQVARAKIRADIRAREEKKQLIEQLRLYEDESNRSICSIPQSKNVTHPNFPPRSHYIGPSEPYMASNKQYDDTAYARLKRVKDLSQLFRDIHITSESYKIELGYFEHQCEMYEINNEQIKYDILLQKWPQKDIKDFWESTSRHERNYHNLYHFLQDKGCSLPKILRPRVASNAPIKYQDLRIEATKWAKATLDDRVKFFTSYLAPDYLKNEVRANFGFNIEEFHLRMAATFVGYEQQQLDSTQNIDYGVREPRFRKI